MGFHTLKLLEIDIEVVGVWKMSHFGKNQTLIYGPERVKLV